MTTTELKAISEPTYTPSDLLSPEQEQQGFPLIRELAGEVLNPGPTWHKLAYIQTPNEITRITGLLVDGEINHIYPKAYCTKCRVLAQRESPWAGDVRGALSAKTCKVTDAAAGSMPDITERLVVKLQAIDDDPAHPGARMARWYFMLESAIEEIWQLEGPDEQFPWWLMSTAAERCVCALMALLPEKVQVNK